MAAVLPLDVAQSFAHSYAVVDVETTGLSAEHDRVVQVAVALMEPGGEVTHQWSSLIDPQRDPGPTHIHGITADRLRGAPTYPQVRDTIHGLVQDRVVVAHNARFDWDFLAQEAQRSESKFPSTERLCTYQLSQRFDLPVPNLKLGTLCTYWGVPQLQAHNAEDDVRCLVDLTRHSLVLAHRLGVDLPLARPRPVGGYPPVAPRTPCVWRYPGRYAADSGLRQGMTLAFTGATDTEREDLIRRSTEAGLDVMNSVSSRTSLLVCNAPEATRKYESAKAHGTAILTEATFLELLLRVAPGTPKAAPQAAPVRETPPQPEPSAPRTPLAAPGPFSRRRILILGGAHDETAEVRARVHELGGSTAVNLTVGVTDVVALTDASADARWTRAQERHLTVLDPVTLEPVDLDNEPRVDLGAQLGFGRATGPVTETQSESVNLPRGGVTDLATTDFTVTATWRPNQLAGSVDVVAFVADSRAAVSADEDFLFYNHPNHPTGVISLDLDSAGEASAEINGSRLGADRRITLAAAIDGAGTFGQLGAIELVVRSSDGAQLARATLDAASEETSMLLAEIYWRNGALRFRAVGQGYQRSLAGLAVSFGVDVEDEA